MTLGKKRGLEQRFPKGDGPDVAKVGSWWRRGEHQPLEGGSGLFTYADASGSNHTTHRFTLGGKKKGKS